MNTYYLLGTRKKLAYLEQLKVIVIQCLGKQHENQIQQMLGKRASEVKKANSDEKEAAPASQPKNNTNNVLNPLDELEQL